MNLYKTILLCGASLLAAAMFSSSAQAQYLGSGMGGGYGYGGGWPYHFQSGIYGRTNAYTLPYFSLHPPVYYSHVVPRPYGFSPFAVPPGVMPAEMLITPKPKMIENPHFKPEGKEAEPKPEDKPKAKGKKTVAVSRAVANPFYRATW